MFCRLNIYRRAIIPWKTCKISGYAPDASECFRLKTDLWHTSIVQVLISSVTKRIKNFSIEKTEKRFKSLSAEDLKQVSDNAENSWLLLLTKKFSCLFLLGLKFERWIRKGSHKKYYLGVFHLFSKLISLPNVVEWPPFDFCTITLVHTQIPIYICICFRLAYQSFNYIYYIIYNIKFWEL